MIKIYEVLAVERELPLFYLDHIKRFKESIGKYKNYSLEALIDITTNLFNSHLPVIPNNNIKITYIVEENSFNLTWIPSTRPPESTYKSGGICHLYNGERENPLVKVVNSEFQSRTRKYCLENNIYDVLLVNMKGEITEGSRSNFILIDRSGNILTSPKGDALEGITRKIVFKVCEKLGLNITQRKISLRDLEECESLLITGTSPEILPIVQCQKLSFKVDTPIISKLIEGFHIEKDIDYNLTGRYFNA